MEKEVQISVALKFRVPSCAMMRDTNHNFYQTQTKFADPATEIPNLFVPLLQTQTGRNGHFFKRSCVAEVMKTLKDDKRPFVGQMFRQAACCLTFCVVRSTTR